MKKSIFLMLTLCLIGTSTVNSQSLFKKVTNSMKDELLGSKKGNTDPEPACACSDAEQVVGLGGKLQIDYKEAEISTMDDGSLLLKDRLSGNYYIVKDNVTTGPLTQGDPRLAGFDESDNNSDQSAVLLLRYKAYISKSGDKYVINFGGKQYGPYAQINSFVMPKSKDKFAAIVIENVVANEAESKKMEQEMNNAKTDQEKMELSVKYAQQIQQKVLQSGGVAGMAPKLVTNIPGAITNISTYMDETINGNAKYDELTMAAHDKINDLTGKTLITLRQNDVGINDIFINTANTKYATYNYGTINFSDGTSLSSLFNPHLVKSGSQVYLAYMYYSPKKNAIMQCKIPW
ncbi:MAG: hypothetical protein ABSA76_04160 [Bacteroidales bacterium]